MDYKRVLTIQDISCVGHCSLTVALPIISACGMECCVLPSAVLSTHTAGFKGYTFRDLTGDMPAIRDHWVKENIKFDTIYTGYLGSAEQINYVKSIIDTCGKENCKAVIDPAFADNGNLYFGFDNEFVENMKTLCAKADYLVPNITEAAFLTGMEYKTEYDKAYINELIMKLADLGAKNVILTGVGFTADKTGVMVYDNGEMQYYEHNKLPNSCHGTGDVYASSFVGALTRGKSAYEAAAIAADYSVECINVTAGDKEHWYGVKFELALPKLIKSLEK